MLKMEKVFFYHTELKDDNTIMAVREKEVDVDELKIDTPEKIYEMAKRMKLDKMTEEYVYAIYVSSALNVIGLSQISHGAIDASIVSTRDVLKNGLILNAKGIVLIHNHPSGVTNPSIQDRKITETLIKACKIMDVKLFDHIIVGRNSYCSLKENSYYLWNDVCV